MKNNIKINKINLRIILLNNDNNINNNNNNMVNCEMIVPALSCE